MPYLIQRFNQRKKVWVDVKKFETLKEAEEKAIKLTKSSNPDIDSGNGLERSYFGYPGCEHWTCRIILV